MKKKQTIKKHRFKDPNRTRESIVTNRKHIFDNNEILKKYIKQNNVKQSRSEESLMINCINDIK